MRERKQIEARNLYHVIPICYSAVNVLIATIASLDTKRNKVEVNHICEIARFRKKKNNTRTEIISMKSDPDPRQLSWLRELCFVVEPSLLLARFKSLKRASARTTDLHDRLVSFRDDQS